jgi:hypothetical protein
LANNATSPSTTTYNGTLHQQLFVIIWIDTGSPPSPIVDDRTLVEDSKPCWNPHANNATSTSTVHLIVTQFTTTAIAAVTTAITANNGTTIPIITPTAAVGCIPTAYQFIAIVATTNMATVAVDASAIHVRSSTAAAAKATTDCLLIVICILLQRPFSLLLLPTTPPPAPSTISSIVLLTILLLLICLLSTASTSLEK